MSQSGFQLATVIDFTWTDANALSGTISHDDGVTLYVNGGTVAASSLPTVEITTPFAAGSGGNYRLIYVAANGEPEVLSVDVDGVVPEPMTLAVWGVLGVCGSAIAWRAKKKQLTT